ncbi:YbhB/YbcL family Raf kinase inhibitor-like protein [Parasulfuritortus cantonensis]|uniref:YbhB/YbcL family Raf kinase inhibitor-like protein n=1 Tax=Parasulfuritortus cantonensis TaxID=2528202 RepID=A0A4R1BDC7_9PROT|nr:YbhB/YbcL family Raf kinase inhibitor-like protein [Parasulfuritortus cantonensis]TCJ14988.1 YbhB/YbcL family Raf kinase inhibitor-like protein [Parasulfuritortus cantonensis]
MYRRLTLACLLAAAASAQAGDFRLTSPELQPGARLADEQVFNGFGCQGGNVSPALAWSGVPAGTKSLAVTVYDPDAPTGSGWWHWLVFNLPADTRALAKGAGAVQAGLMPAGAVQSRTDFNQPGYGGPCPPVGDKPHRYIFTVYALKADSLPLDANAPAAMVGFYLHQNTLGKAVLTGRYGR